jgi:hypothetical protein
MQVQGRCAVAATHAWPRSSRRKMKSLACDGMARSPDFASCELYLGTMLIASARWTRSGKLDDDATRVHH